MASTNSFVPSERNAAASDERADVRLPQVRDLVRHVRFLRLRAAILRHLVGSLQEEFYADEHGAARCDARLGDEMLRVEDGILEEMASELLHEAARADHRARELSAVPVPGAMLDVPALFDGAVSEQERNDPTEEHAEIVAAAHVLKQPSENAKLGELPDFVGRRS